MKRWVVVLMMCLIFFVSVEAKVWYVHPDSSLNTIQAGLDSCADNDIVLVGPGTYNENIAWPNTQGIDLLSESGPAVTKINGNNQNTVIDCRTAWDTTTVIKGFTIMNGYGYSGGGIYCEYSSPTIMQNIFVNNRTYFRGGALDCVGSSSPVIKQNVIMNNNSVWGAGILIGDNCLAVITGNTINANVADSAAGGILYSLDGGGTFRNNTVTNNQSHWLGGGIGIYDVTGTPVTISNNTISNNIADCNGGGIACSLGTAVIESCRILNNSIDGIWCGGSNDITISYCDITGNAAYGVRNNYAGDTVNAENNWWGDSTGPYHPTLNPTGQGDTVSDYVDFIPWLGRPVKIAEPLLAFVKRNHNITIQTIVKGSMLTFEVGQPCKLTLQLYDISGRERWAINAKVYSAGVHRLNLPKLANGIYFLRCNSERAPETHKLVFIQ